MLEVVRKVGIVEAKEQIDQFDFDALERITTQGLL
jgi:hypothetical protein